MNDPAGKLEQLEQKIGGLATLLSLHKELGGIAMILFDLQDEITEIECEIRRKTK